jgi:pimeloyl-ACP methyl ester carboxylesterase
MRRLTERWRDGFDWRAQEAKLNAFEQFRVLLDGIKLHLIHQPGIGPDPLPLLLVHGWPGSVWEFHELIPRLTDPARYGATRGTPSRSSHRRFPASRSRSSQASGVSASSRWPISSRG